MFAQRFKRLTFLGFEASALPVAVVNAAKPVASSYAVVSSPADAAQLVGTEALVVPLGFSVDRALLGTLPGLRCVAVLGTDLSGVDLQLASERGVAVYNLPGYSTDSVAELVFGLLLEHFRGVSRARERARQGRLDEASSPGRLLRGRRFGVLGMGAIGQTVARIAALGFGADVRYWSRARRPELESALGIQFQPLDELIASVEVMAVHLALTPETRGLLHAERVERFSRGAVLVHLSPLGIVDLSALEQRLSRAELDFIFDHGDELPAPVFARLKQHAGCIAYPPIGYDTYEASENRARQLGEALWCAARDMRP